MEGYSVILGIAKMISGERDGSASYDMVICYDTAQDWLMERIGSRTDGKMDEWTNGQITSQWLAAAHQSLNPLALPPSIHHQHGHVRARSGSCFTARFRATQYSYSSYIMPPRGDARAHRDGGDDDGDDGVCHVPCAMMGLVVLCRPRVSWWLLVLVETRTVRPDTLGPQNERLR